MSAEDELLPQDRLPPVDPAYAWVLAGFWDDTLSDRRNVEIIRWWLSLPPHDDPRNPC